MKRTRIAVLALASLSLAPTVLAQDEVTDMIEDGMTAATKGVGACHGIRQHDGKLPDGTPLSDVRRTKCAALDTLFITFILEDQKEIYRDGPVSPEQQKVLDEGMKQVRLTQSDLAYYSQGGAQ